MKWSPIETILLCTLVRTLAPMSGNILVTPFTMETAICALNAYEIETSDSEGNTLLNWLIINTEHTRDVERCIQHGAVVVRASADGKTPLYVALEGYRTTGDERFIEIVNILATKGACRYEYPHNDYHPTLALLRTGRVHPKEYRLLRQLSRYGLELSVTNKTGWSLLHYYTLASSGEDSLSHPSTKCVRELIRCGCNPDITAHESITPLMLAAKYSRTLSSDSTLLTLLRNGANVDAQNSNGWTALMYSAKYSSSLSSRRTITLLVEYGADVNLSSVTGMNALMIAIRSFHDNQDIGTIRLIANSGTDLTHRTGAGKTVASMALGCGLPVEVLPSLTTRK